MTQRVIHPSYIDGGADLALLRLGSRAPTSLPRLEIADEAVMGEIANPGNMVTVSGWAVTETAGDVPDVLHSVNLYIQNISDCEEVVGNIPDNSLCLFGLNSDDDPIGACTGDSGSPVTATKGQDEFLVGVVNSIRARNPKDYPELLGKDQCTISITSAARVSHFKNWIENTIRPISGLRVCVFNDPDSGTTPGCTQRAIWGGGPTVAYEIMKDGVFLLNLTKTTDQWSWNRPCTISTSSSAYIISGNCQSYRILHR